MSQNCRARCALICAIFFASFSAPSFADQIEIEPQEASQELEARLLSDLKASSSQALIAPEELKAFHSQLLRESAQATSMDSLASEVQDLRSISCFDRDRSFDCLVCYQVRNEAVFIKVIGFEGGEMAGAAY